MDPEVVLTLDEAVAEVLGQLTGLDLEYQPELDRYQAITRQLNRALRANALEKDWSYYATTVDLGLIAAGQIVALLPPNRRLRSINDDAVRIVDSDGMIRAWAYVLPRDALHKYQGRNGLWCSVSQQGILFNRPFSSAEVGWHIEAPVMREPVMFRLPQQPEDPEATATTVPQEIRDQPVDFPYPDVIISRAAFYYAQTDPVMQPRVQTLEGVFKDLMYQLFEREDANTDTPFLNDFVLDLQNSVVPESPHHHHPHSAYRE